MYHLHERLTSKYSRFAPAACNWWGMGCCNDPFFYLLFSGINAATAVFTTSCDLYSAIANSWAGTTTIVAPARYSATSSTLANNCYSSFGNSTNSTVSALLDNDRYDLIAATWTSRTDGPAPARGFSKMGMEGDGIFFVSTGIDSTNALIADTDRYNELVDFWTASTSISTPRDSCAIRAINNVGYVVGGRTIVGSSTFITNNDSLDMPTETWTIKTGLTVAAESGCPAVINGKFYYVGGEEQTGPFSSATMFKTSEYDPDTDAWTARTITPRNRISIPSATDPTGGVGYFTTIANTLHDSYTPDTWAAKTAGTIRRSGAGAS
jgi:hypothetical protein